MYFTKRVLVTGGAGFIGSHLCDTLVDMNCDVMCLDNFFTGHKRNIVHLFGRNNFEIIRHDVVQPVYLETDEIYNLACPASPIHYQFNPIKTIKTNVMGAINMLGMAKRVKARILQASTSEVYGDPEEHPQREAYWGRVNPIGKRACYDEGKRSAETLCFDYYRQAGVNIRVARIFNTYGPRMNLNDGRVVSSFIVRALTGRDIAVYGDGSQSRSFCYIDDMIKGLISFMEIPDDHTGPINLGNPEEITILELAEKIIEITNSKSPVVYKDAQSDDPSRRMPDINLAREKLKWEPKVTLDEGLRKTAEYFDSILKTQKVRISDSRDSPDYRID